MEKTIHSTSETKHRNAVLALWYMVALTAWTVCFAYGLDVVTPPSMSVEATLVLLFLLFFCLLPTLSWISPTYAAFIVIPGSLFWVLQGLFDVTGAVDQFSYPVMDPDSTVIFAWDLPIQDNDVYAVDGDTLMIGGSPVRLWGIDAPELEQTCQEYWGGEWHDSDCGRSARNYLDVLIEGEELRCVAVPDARYGYDVRQCSVYGDDLARKMVLAGWALDFRKFSDDRYYTDELTARAGHRGMWHWQGFRFDAPWEWRNHRRPPLTPRTPQQVQSVESWRRDAPSTR